ncbi:MAG: DUF2243 domain-containing protein [Gemmatimonadaceae bacterium]
MTTMPTKKSTRRVRSGALLLGVGLGAFVDGIVLQQILGWHNMLSARIPPDTIERARTSMTGDGWFHAFAWIVTAIGVFRLYTAARAPIQFPPIRWFVGMLLIGCGVFNTIEGTVDHLLLDLHHVRDVPVYIPEWDWGFLLVAGIGFIIIGAVLARD